MAKKKAKKKAKRKAAKKKVKKKAKKKAAKNSLAKGKSTKKESGKKKSEEHPIGQAIDKFLHRVWGIEYSVAISIPKVIDVHIENINKVKAKLAATMKLVEHEDDSINKIGFREMSNFLPKARRVFDSDIIEITMSGYFLSLFGAFDSYTGDLLSAIYLKKPALFNRLKRSMSIPEMLGYDSLEDIKSIILEKEIESFRRDSYIDQFETLESMFDVKLKGFKRWPQFVECGQRRNLWAHCNGTISDQYLKICKKVGYLCDESLKVGDKLKISFEYLVNTIELMIEVGLELGQTLWRKVFPEELEKADEHLTYTIFELLKRKRWDMAQTLSEFAVSLPRHFNDVRKMIFVVNYAIALKFGRKFREAKKVLSKRDWSATLIDFKLAEAVLHEDYDRAAKLMKRIGRDGEFLHEYAYHDWPLFLKFRDSNVFLQAYESIYGHSFAAESKRIAEVVKAVTEKGLRRKKQEIQKIPRNINK